MNSSTDPAPSLEETALAAGPVDTGISIKHVPDTTETRKKICIVGASGKLGQYLIQHALNRGYEVVGVCREQSAVKLAHFGSRIRIITGPNDDSNVIRQAVAGCDAVLTVLVPFGMRQYALRTVQAVLAHAPPEARLIFSCGWHISRDGQDVYPLKFRAIVKVFGVLGRLTRFGDLNDQVQACNHVFASSARWTVVRGSDLEEGESQGVPVWSGHVGDAVLASNLTRRTDFALFMIEAIGNEALMRQAPAIVGRLSASALTHHTTLLGA
ncbi:NAD(P)-dependent oxidoreductase [Deinococcus marmoris]|nr:NAD(P)H-binding protein [Deinococcus marmoris]